MGEITYSDALNHALKKKCGEMKKCSSWAKVLGVVFTV